MNGADSLQSILADKLPQLSIRGIGLWSAAYLELPASVLLRNKHLDRSIEPLLHQVSRIVEAMIDPVPMDATIFEPFYEGEHVDYVAENLSIKHGIGKAGYVVAEWIATFWISMPTNEGELDAGWSAYDSKQFRLFALDLTQYQELQTQYSHLSNVDLEEVLKLIAPYSEIGRGVVGNPIPEAIIESVLQALPTLGNFIKIGASRSSRETKSDSDAIA